MTSVLSVASDPYPINGQNEDSDDWADDEHYRDGCEERITEWDDDGLFTPEIVLNRLTDIILEYDYYFEGLRSTFARATTNSSTGCLDAISFGDFVTQRVPLPKSVMQPAALVIFDLVAFASSLPSPAPSQHRRLHFNEFMRAITILSPPFNRLNSGSLSESVVLSRSRTRRDGLRVIFEGLASSGQYVQVNDAVLLPVYDPTFRDDEAERDDPEYTGFFIDVSNEDARTTDLLDVLYVSQPDQNESYMRVARCFFKGIASRLLASHVQQAPAPTLYNLQLLRERMRSVIRCAIAVEMMDASEAEIPTLVMEEVELETERLVDIMFPLGVDGIGWVSFVDGVKKAIPNLAKLIEGLLGAVFEFGDYPREAPRWFKEATGMQITVREFELEADSDSD